MCGFVAVVGQAEAEPVIFGMLDAIRSRGPDDRAACFTDWFALGFCRLAIYSLEAGSQPVTSVDGKVTIVFNGEIYNFPALACTLQQRTGVRVRSEAELLLQGYLTCGSAFVQELDGDFAIVVFDGHRRTCELWRDPFGVKPLYYVVLPGKRQVLIASEIRGLLAHPDFSPAWDEVALAERFALSFWARERTPFKMVRQVQPQHKLILGPYDGDGRATDTIREIAYVPARSAPLPDTNDLVAVCTEVITRSIAKRIFHTEVKPVVIALSGGVDSSIIAAIASRYSESTVAVTMCGGLNEPDAQYAAAVTKELGITHHLYQVTGKELFAKFPAVVLTHPASGAFLAWLLANTMACFEPQAKVLLCGEGADEHFFGYPVYRNHTPFKVQALKRLAQLPTGLVSESSLLRRVLDWQSADDEPSVSEVAALFAEHQLVNRHLVPFDHGTMAHGIECRVPYLDLEITRLLEQVPRNLLITEASGKLLLRHVLARVFHDQTALYRALLTRPPSAAPSATYAARAQLRQVLEARLKQSSLATSWLAQFARSQEELFWLGATQVVYMSHQGRIDGMSFDDLLHEATNVTA